MLGSHQILPPWFASTVLMVQAISQAGSLEMNFYQPKDLVSCVIPLHGQDL